MPTGVQLKKHRRPAFHKQAAVDAFAWRLSSRAGIRLRLIERPKVVGPFHSNHSSGVAGIVSGRARQRALSLATMFHLHCTKKLLDRINPEISAPGQSDTVLGNWYATVLFWKPQVALLVSERTLLPVLMPLAPAATLARRFPAQLALVLKEHGIPSEFIAQEVWRMDEVQYAKTGNRSVVGILCAATTTMAG